MAGYVIRRERKPVAIESAPASPIAQRAEVPKVTSAPSTPEQMSRARAVRLRAEVLGEFRSHGARIDRGDPMTCARDEYRCEESKR